MSALDPDASVETLPVFSFDGQDIPFVPGQSIGAALLAHGIPSWRTTRIEQRPRGLFCGIGVCFDCLVTVDQRRSQRACLVPAVPGAVVDSVDPGAPLVVEEEPSSPAPGPAAGSREVATGTPFRTLEGDAPRAMPSEAAS